MRSISVSGLLPLVMLLLAAATGVHDPGVAVLDAQVRELAATPLEAFATDPGSVTVWANPIGRLESPASRAIVTAVAVSNRRSLETMRGVRVDLVHLQPPRSCNLRFVSHAVLCARPNAAIYFEEDILGRVLEGIAQGNAERSLLFSYRHGSSSDLTTGLIIGGYTFEGRQTADLATLIERARVALEHAPQ